MVPTDASYTDEAGELYKYKTIHLHPKFYYGFVISEIHDTYAGYYRFYMYDLNLKTIEVKEIDGSEYGYHKAIGPSFTIFACNRYLENTFPNDGESYKHTIIYNVLTDKIMIHPISHNWFTQDSNRLGFDGLNGSLYLVSPYGIKGYEGNMETNEEFAYYYDYKTEEYLNKSFIVNNYDKTKGFYLDCTIIGLLEDNTAIILIKDLYDEYIFRF